MDTDASHSIPYDSPYRSVLLSSLVKLPRKAQLSYNIYKIYICNETKSQAGSNKTPITTLLLIAQILYRRQIEATIELDMNINLSQERWFPRLILTFCLAEVDWHQPEVLSAKNLFQQISRN